MPTAPALAAAELIAERPDERLDTCRLEPYLHARLPGAEGALSVAQFHGGKANLTYLLRFGEREYVLRRPPLGPIPPGAHDMRREHRVLSALHRAYPLAPPSLLLCEDESVTGAMNWRRKASSCARTRASSVPSSSSRNAGSGL